MKKLEFKNTTLLDVQYESQIYQASLHHLAYFGPISELETKVRHYPELIHEVDEAGLTPLHYAARSGQLESFKRILLCSVDTEYDMAEEDESDYMDDDIQDLLDFHTKRSRCNILHSAALSGNIEMVKYLFESMGEETRNKMEKFLLERQESGKLPAHSAVKGGSIEVFEYLYSKNPSIHNQQCTTSKGETYIVIAAGTGNFDLFKYFFENNIHFPRRILPNKLYEKALKGGNLQIIEYIESQKEEIFKYVTKLDYLPIHIFSAIESGKVEIVQFLMENEAFKKTNFLSSVKSLKRSSSIEVSPVSYAAYLGDTKIVNYFISILNDKLFEETFYTHGKIKTLPIWFAASRHKTLFQFILNQLSEKQRLSTHTVSIEGNKYEWNLFHFATAFCKNRESFVYLYKCFNANDKLKEKLKDDFLSLEKGMSIIEVACRENNLEVLKYLQDRKLLPNIDEYMKKNIQKLFISAARRKHSQILSYLLSKYGDHLDYVNDIHNNPLISVARWCKDFHLLNELSNYLHFSDGLKTEIQLEALKVALEFGNPVTSKFLLEINNFDVISDSFPVFHYAAKGGSIECLKAVIDKLPRSIDDENHLSHLKDKFVPDFNFDSCQVTPLHLAVYFQHYDVVSFLLDTLGVNANACIPGFATPLHFACSPQFIAKGGCTPPNIKIVELLLDHGAWKSSFTRAYTVINIGGFDLTPYDCALNHEVREMLEQRCPRTLATKILLPLDEYEKRRES